jgi:hypothetical protein
VQLALEALVIQFLNHARPGVRFTIPSERSMEMAGESKATVKRIAAKAQKRSRRK